MIGFILDFIVAVLILLAGIWGAVVLIKLIRRSWKNP